MEILFEYLGRGFMTMLMVSMPVVLTAAAIGLVIGVIQAVTQVQEQTIVAAPKILSVFLVIIILGFWFAKIIMNLTLEGTAIAFNVIPKNDTYVLDSNYYRYTKPFAAEMKDANMKNQPSINELMNGAGRAPFIDKNSRIKYLPAPKNAVPRPNFIETNKILGR